MSYPSVLSLFGLSEGLKPNRKWIYSLPDPLPDPWSPTSEGHSDDRAWA